MRTLICLFIVFLSVSVGTVRGQDWPQWMGEKRDGTIHATEGWLREIPDTGLTVQWRTPAAGGYAGPAVVGNRVYLADYAKQSGESFNNPGKRANLQGNERLVCLDATSGKQLWVHQYECPYSISYPAGPRCTPTVDKDRVYMLGAEGGAVGSVALNL